jgi:hypothetical protein
MRLNKPQLKVDILFIMSTRSSKYWRGKELCPYLAQLGHDDPTPKKIKDTLVELFNIGAIERVRVKPQWALFAYKLTGKVTHDTIVFHGGAVPIRRTVEDNIWG